MRRLHEQVFCILSTIVRCRAFFSVSHLVEPRTATRVVAATVASGGVQDEAMHPPEHFSVAPMVGHTNRHFRYLFRLLSKRAWLHTEMMPAATVVHAESIGKVSELLRFHSVEQPLSLQLGGNDPVLLAQAAAIGARLGYSAINLNCGCPSTAVSGSGRTSGAALMANASHVALCCRAMAEAVARESASTTCSSTSLRPLITVKHRLGIAEAAMYDPRLDIDPEEDYATAKAFIETVSTGCPEVARFHVHARKAILGMGVDYGCKNEHGREINASGKERSQSTASAASSAEIWTPQVEKCSGNRGFEGGAVVTLPEKKVDHKRVQYQAKKRARSVTLANRSVPPLRPGVVHLLAKNFPHLDIVANGGCDSVDAALAHLAAGASGAMVGRAVVTHPCAFAMVDQALDKVCKAPQEHAPRCATRGEVLEAYLKYVLDEEARVFADQCDQGRMAGDYSTSKTYGSRNVENANPSGRQLRKQRSMPEGEAAARRRELVAPM